MHACTHIYNVRMKKRIFNLQNNNFCICLIYKRKLIGNIPKHRNTRKKRQKILQRKELQEIQKRNPKKMAEQQAQEEDRTPHRECDWKPARYQECGAEGICFLCQRRKWKAIRKQQTVHLVQIPTWPKSHTLVLATSGTAKKAYTTDLGAGNLRGMILRGIHTCLTSVSPKSRLDKDMWEGSFFLGSASGSMDDQEERNRKGKGAKITLKAYCPGGPHWGQPQLLPTPKIICQGKGRLAYLPIDFLPPLI